MRVSGSKIITLVALNLLPFRRTQVDLSGIGGGRTFVEGTQTLIIDLNRIKLELKKRRNPRAAGDAVNGRRPDAGAFIIKHRCCKSQRRHVATGQLTQRIAA